MKERYKYDLGVSGVCGLNMVVVAAWWLISNMLLWRVNITFCYIDRKCNMYTYLPMYVPCYLNKASDAMYFSYAHISILNTHIPDNTKYFSSYFGFLLNM